MNKIYRYAAVSITAVLLPSSALSAQSECLVSGDIRETELVGAGSDYARLTELAPTGYVTPRMARRLSNSMIQGCAVGPWRSRVAYRQSLDRVFNMVPFSVSVTYNSAYPEDRNNGALWSGRGFSTAFQGGVIVRAGPVSIGLVPEFTYQGNRPYELLPPFTPSYSQFSSGLYAGLDAPQRFGPKAYSELNLGQSYVSVAFGKFVAGFSGENVWWGPGTTNAILFTNTAPGFAHAFFNLRQPVSVGIGKVSAEALWGRLSESRFFDTVKANDHRMIVGAVLTLEPKWTPGLFLSFGRTFVVPWDSITARNLFPLGRGFVSESFASPSNPRGNTNDDQRLSLMARYVFPASGFELYGEWAREDAAWDWSDFIQEPEHSSGYVIGAQKLFIPSDRGWVRVYAEATDLQQLRQDRPGIRPTPNFYVHGPQGHTQLGQLLGASIGPGGESQVIGIDVLSTRGLVGAYLERVRRDEFSERGVAAWSTAWPPRHDVETTAGLRLTNRMRKVRMDLDFAHSKRYNRNFIRNESNVRLKVNLTWAEGK